MGWYCSGVGSGGMENWSALGPIARILPLAVSAGRLIGLGLASVWLTRQLLYHATVPQLG